MSREIMAFCCEHSAYSAADLAGRLALHCPEKLRVIPVPCAGRIDTLHILKAFENGAAAVVVLGCEEGACHHITGNTRAKERVKLAEVLLKEIGGNGRYVAMSNLSPNAPHKFVKIIDEMNEKIKRSGEAK